MPVEQRGQVIHVKMESTGNRRNSCLGGSPAGLPWGGTSRMRREFHVRICEGLGVKFPGPTRRTGQLVSLPRSTTDLMLHRIANQWGYNLASRSMDFRAVAFPALVAADDGWVQYLSEAEELSV